MGNSRQRVSGRQACKIRSPLVVSSGQEMPEIDVNDLLRAYAYGIFPMAESADSDELLWFEPVMRGLIPLEGFHVSSRLRRTVRQDRFELSHDIAFREVMMACAGNSRTGRETTWINRRILDLYTELHRHGFAHSVETWRDGRLVGGLYGVSLGGAFFGESMFSLETDASKVALVHLVARLRFGGYRLLDTQWLTAHLSQFGAFEVPKTKYRRLLQEALEVQGDFDALPSGPSGAAVLQVIDRA
jgi:leucyl/phenylalanyl-tRNA--protein transferase